MTTDAFIIVHVHDRPGVLARIASMFYRRGLNVRSLTVSPVHVPEISTMTVRVSGPKQELDRLVPAIDNLVDVLSVTLANPADVYAHELCLVRVETLSPAARDVVAMVASAYRASIVTDEGEAMVLEVTAAPDDIDRLVQTLRPLGPMEVGRTGVTTLRMAPDRPAVATSEPRLHAVQGPGCDTMS